MDLTQYPRRIYTPAPTPVIELKRLSSLLKCGRIYLKRDDLLGLTGGGNKTRKLEFVVADALKQGADTLVTCGGLQSNHCRLTAAAAVKEGMKCRLILVEEPHQTYDREASGNNLLYHLLGVDEITVIKDMADLDSAMARVAEQVRDAGGTPYLIPLGASTPIGCLGYIACAREIAAQSAKMDVHFDYVVCATGSGGTQAGLVMGFTDADYTCRVLGMNVSRSAAEQEVLVRELIDRTISELGLDLTVGDERIACFDKGVGDGYAMPSAEMVRAVKLTAATEGILLDPVYTGKAMVGLFDLMQRDYFQIDDRILFIQTGGTPALYTQPELFV
ncbi:D-cysteine desulfhydrase [bacterium]|nr:D-cysteine desulfhydrase [bacterium]